MKYFPKFRNFFKNLNTFLSAFFFKLLCLIFLRKLILDREVYYKKCEQQPSLEFMEVFKDWRRQPDQEEKQTKFSKVRLKVMTDLLDF